MKLKLIPKNALFLLKCPFFSTKTLKCNLTCIFCFVLQDKFQGEKKTVSVASKRKRGMENGSKRTLKIIKLGEKRVEI